MSIHLSPTAPLAGRALLPADPGLALGLGQALLEKPRMFNHTHGLWGYTGTAADGLPLTIQSTGIGGPSAAVVLDELAGLGLRRAIRVGTCSVVGPDRPTAAGTLLGLGDLLIVEAAVAADGTSRALGTGRPPPTDQTSRALGTDRPPPTDQTSRALGTGRPPPTDQTSRALGTGRPPPAHRTSRAFEPGGVAPADVELTAAICRAAPPATRRGVILSTDVFYAAPDGLRTLVEEAGAVAVDLETAALLTLGRLTGVAVACVVVVADLLFDGGRQRIDAQSLDDASERAGRLAAGGLVAGRDDAGGPAPAAGRPAKSAS